MVANKPTNGVFEAGKDEATPPTMPRPLIPPHPLAPAEGVARVIESTKAPLEGIAAIMAASRWPCVVLIVLILSSCGGQRLSPQQLAKLFERVINGHIVPDGSQAEARN